ncbi:unnamed protein product [Darwinula stevensoni]|uniref:Uncharacterized protein n=1 Tax=Darwinula stevensoni TaxID=69355 RepID=A0A7R8XB44_9CRUS|nr:unnamed protein product [Darwinula stevensoni]CAG0884446.1 unnamed protein product [Darwinula stevensoni]
MHCVIASSSVIPLLTSVIDMKDLLESLRKPNQWILSNVKDLKVSDLPESLKNLSLVELDLVLVGEGEKHPDDAQEDPPDTPRQGENNSNGEEHFEFETEDAIGDITAEEFLENEDTDIFGHDFIHLSSSWLSKDGEEKLESLLCLSLDLLGHGESLLEEVHDTPGWRHQDQCGADHLSQSPLHEGLLHRGPVRCPPLVPLYCCLDFLVVGVQ